jgi:hypothetical protein
MWQLTEPFVKVGNCVHALRKHGEIASVDQDVAIRNINLAMKLMRIAKKHKAQRGV